MIFIVFLLVTCIVNGDGFSSMNIENTSNKEKLENKCLDLFENLEDCPKIKEKPEIIDLGDEEPEETIKPTISSDDLNENHSDWNSSSVIVDDINNSFINLTPTLCSNCSDNLNLSINKTIEENESLREGSDFVSGHTTIYIYGHNLIASKNNNESSVTYYSQDFLGSNRVTTDEYGNVINKNVQYPYGDDFNEKGSKEGLSNNYKFTGQEEDEDLYYYGARYYDPSISRFISVDPIYSSDISPYAYAGNNPLKYVDPSGEQVAFANNIKARAEPIINFLAKFSYSVKEVKNSEFVIRYSISEDLRKSARMFGTDPVSFDKIQPKWGYIDSNFAVFLRKGQNDIRFFHTLVHETMHGFALTRDKDSVLMRHSDEFYSILDEIRTELKIKHELGLENKFDVNLWNEIG